MPTFRSDDQTRPTGRFLTIDGTSMADLAMVGASLATGPDNAILFDLAHLATPLSPAVIETVVELLEDLAGPGGGRWAVVTRPVPLEVGMARMFAIRTSLHGVTTEAFTDVGDAIEWLARPAETEEENPVFESFAMAGGRRH